MRINERHAIATNTVLLVPYEAHHVLKYHDWMKDPDIQEATASEPMTLEEEYENQQSWRTSHDKLTFIICTPLNTMHDSQARQSIQAQEDDTDGRTRGDINFFVYPDDEDEGSHTGKRRLRGEVDVMIADKHHRGQGMGESAVRALLLYLRRHESEILKEYMAGEGAKDETPSLVGLMAKIKENNVGSRALFKKLGFRQEGEVNYFGEVKMVLDWGEVEAETETETRLGYRELEYRRLGEL